MRRATWLLLLAVACGDDSASVDASTRDTATADTGDDAGGDDAGGDDAGDDAGGDDAGGDDAGGDDAGGDDAGGDDAGDDAGDMCATIPLGDTCEGDCSDGYECDGDRGRCVPPSGRPICGGFAGATCDTAEFPQCLFYSSADFGHCLTAAELECACSNNPGEYACPE